MPFSANASSIISVFLMSTVLSSRAAAKKHGQVSAVTNSFGQGMPGAQRSATLDKSNLVSSSLHLRYSAASRSLHNSFLNTDKKHLDKTRSRAKLALDELAHSLGFLCFIVTDKKAQETKLLRLGMPE